MNAETNRPYSGINIVLAWLAMHGNPQWTRPHFITFKGAKRVGGTVKARPDDVLPGHWGTKIIFYKQLEVKDRNKPDDPEALKRIPMLREFTVFNVDQCEGLPARVVSKGEAKSRHDDQREPLIDAFLAATNANIKEGGAEAYFAPGLDVIAMPAFQAFKSGPSYYHTLFHELGHWTGHKSRLDRDLKTDKGTQDYALEELVAELTSAFLCAEFNIDGAVRHVDYIGHWIARLKTDSRAFLKAAAKAQKAADYLRGLALADDFADVVPADMAA
jgi:antirestriction protein ArdC